MPPKEHARLSASGAELWMHCPGSVHMKDIFPDESSPAAEEGTLAHALGEVMIKDRLGLITKDEAAAEYEQIHAKVDDFYDIHRDMPDTYEDMKDYMISYADFVLDEYMSLKDFDRNARICIEQKVSYEKIVPGGHGTSDVIIVGGDTCKVIDLKYGKGVPVSAVHNPQIRLYAYGAVHSFDLLYEFRNVKMMIYQPRLDNFTDETLTIETLDRWAKEIVNPCAEKALSESPEYHPGEWCHSHFCPGRGTCRARAEEMIRTASGPIRDPALLSPQEMGNMLDKLDGIKSWTHDLEEAANTRAIQNHQHIPGWKVVEGQSRRKIVDSDSAIRILEKAGYRPDEVSERKLIGISKLEKKIGSKEFYKLLGNYIEKPPGAPKLVPESDKRPPLATGANITKDDFI